ncbi:S41 family peptidase [Aquimarina sp. 2201CG1-2-11]|uniref:S41 family peptidase n=1 Tax=Aquimarina discodermiae TaxID=3231043 RepID=UPI0034628DB7
MKLNYNTVLVFLLFPLVVFGQKKLSKEQITEDYSVIKNVLTKGYPSLYEYTSASTWDSLFTDFEEKKLGSIRNQNDFYKAIVELTDHVRDGHLIVMRPQLNSIPKLFPLLVKIITKKLYTDTDDFGIPVGSEILSIDGVDGAELRKKLMKYTPSDGFITTKKDRQVEREFGILHFYEFGVKSNYQVVYKTPSHQTKIKNIESQPFKSIGKRFAKRKSYFARNTLGQKEPSLYFVDSLHTAVLTLNTFNLNVEKFGSALKDSFKEIRKKKAQNLIIDIRQNEGGYPINAINAFSYIASTAFKQRISSEVTTPTLPEKHHSQNLVNGYTYETFFKKYYQKEEKKGDKWILMNDENKPLMIPNKKRFEGNVNVLIGGKTFSAGASFALFCKNEGITLVGEETGGGYYTQTGGYPIIYTLPHSDIKILIPFEKINRYVKDTTVKKGRGILPDKEVQLTVQDLIHEKDSQLEYILKQISSK